MQGNLVLMGRSKFWVLSPRNAYNDITLGDREVCFQKATSKIKRSYTLQTELPRTKKNEALTLAKQKLGYVAVKSVRTI